MRLSSSIRLLLSCSCLMLLAVGCAPKASVSGLVPAGGVVTVDGVAMEGVSISFFPVNKGADDISVGATSESGGKFALGYRNPGEGARPGVYRVTASKQTILNPISQEEASKLSEAGRDHVPQYKYDVPQKYNDAKTSGIEITIPEKGDKNIRLELTSK